MVWDLAEKIVQCAMWWYVWQVAQLPGLLDPLNVIETQMSWPQNSFYSGFRGKKATMGDICAFCTMSPTTSAQLRGAQIDAVELVSLEWSWTRRFLLGNNLEYGRSYNWKGNTMLKIEIRTCTLKISREKSWRTVESGVWKHTVNPIHLLTPKTHDCQITEYQTRSLAYARIRKTR